MDTSSITKLLNEIIPKYYIRGKRLKKDSQAIRNASKMIKKEESREFGLFRLGELAEYLLEKECQRKSPENELQEKLSKILTELGMK